MTRRMKARSNVIPLRRQASEKAALSPREKAISEAFGLTLKMDEATLRTWIAIAHVLLAPAATGKAAATLHLFPPGRHPAFQPVKGN